MGSQQGILGRVNSVVSVSPLLLDICSTLPEVATHGEGLYWGLRKHRTMFSSTSTVQHIVSLLAPIIPRPVGELVEAECRPSGPYIGAT